MRFAIYLLDCIKTAGYKTRSAFADAVGQKPSVVTKWLSGTHNFTADTLWLISKVLHVDFLPVSKPVSRKAGFRLYCVNVSSNAPSDVTIVSHGFAHAQGSDYLTVSAQPSATTIHSQNPSYA
jgi:transcriptional regulator with XRE-family HTH domain